MATILTEIATIATETTHKAKIRSAIAWQARVIGTQVLSDPSPTPNDKLRLKLAREILTDASKGTWEISFAWCVAATPAITLNSTDQEILDAVLVIWDVLAGVTV